MGIATMRAALLAAVMACGLATGARAAVVAYDTNFYVTAQALALGDDPVQSLTAFDPSLGTLTAVNVEVKGTFGLGPYFLLPTAAPLPTMASITPHLNFYPLPQGTITYATQANLPVFNSSIQGLQSFSFDETGALPLSYAAEPILNLQPFTTISNANGNYDNADTGDADPSTINGFARVSYTYTAAATATAVPEPVSIALLGVGLAGIGVTRRRAA